MTDTPNNPVHYPQAKEGLEKLNPYKLKVPASRNNVYVIANGAETYENLTTSDIFIRSVTKKGETFSEEINVSNSTGIESTRAEIEATGDNVYVSWWDKSGGKDQPMIKISNDGGQPFGKQLC